jgi:TRAP-type C4-dicarboxylate transport system permease small subunit
VLWGAAFVLKDSDEIRMDFIASNAGPRIRRIAGAISALGVIVLFGMSLPASYAYVSFMKVEKSSYLGIRMDVMYAIYLVFVVAVIARSLRQLIRGPAPATSELPSSSSSAL